MTFDKNVISTTGERLRFLRKSIGVNQIKFAKLLNINQVSLSRYENNERKISDDVLERVANLWNININWLITGKGQPFEGSTSIMVDNIDSIIDKNQTHANTIIEDEKAVYTTGNGGIKINKKMFNEWFNEQSEHDQVGIVFSVIYRWSEKNKRVLWQTLGTLLGVEK